MQVAPHKLSAVLFCLHSVELFCAHQLLLGQKSLFTTQQTTQVLDFHRLQKKAGGLPVSFGSAWQHVLIRKPLAHVAALWSPRPAAKP